MSIRFYFSHSKLFTLKMPFSCSKPGILGSWLFLSISISIIVLSGAIVLSGEAQAQKITDNAFNPAISLILDGRYTEYSDAFELPGFQLGGEAGLPETGFSLGHSELSLSANVDDAFYGYTTVALAQEEGATEVELEEAFIETLGLGQGFTLKMGRFYSHIGYLNSIHDHAHDFTDVPLVYAGLVGNHLTDQGIQVRWVAPLPVYLEAGVEITSGEGFPGGENENHNRGRALFVKTGADLNESASWQLGVFGYETKFDERTSGGHHHGEAEEAAHSLNFNEGEVSLYGVDWVYKWAPNGNPTRRNFKFQWEYFQRDESAEVAFTEDADQISGDYDGIQKGFYVQSIYQFKPRWRAGLRYDYLKPDNDFSNFAGSIDPDEFLEETELGADEAIERVTTMLDYSRSEFSRIRFQWSKVDTGENTDDQFMLQYLMSLGSHGAHKF